MSDSSPPINPYAPPTSSPNVPRSTEHRMWREGDWLFFRNDAIFPPHCMVTGEAALYAHPINQIWQPKWTYLLLLPAVVPYVLFSPFIRRRLEITLPFGETVYRKHRRWVRAGLLLILVGALLVIYFMLTAIGGWLDDIAALSLASGVISFLVGLQLASSSPVRLNVFKIEGGIVILKNVHPKYLALFPDATEAPW